MLSQRHRQRVLPRVDSLARRVGLYAAYRVGRSEYVGTIRSDAGIPGAIDIVVNAGYEYNGLSALKWHPDTGAPDEGSYRRVPADHPDLPRSPRICEWAPRDCQYHVHLFAGEAPDAVEVFSHYELRPDLFRPTLNLARKRIHYRPEYGEEYLRGIACESIRARVT